VDNFRTPFSALLHAKGLYQRRQRGRLLPPARVVEEVPGKRRTPVFEHAHQRPARDLRRDVLFEGERQPQAIDSGPNHEVRIVDDQRSAHINDDGFIAFLELPPVGPRRAGAQVDASVVRQTDELIEDGLDVTECGTQTTDELFAGVLSAPRCVSCALAGARQDVLPTRGRRSSARTARRPAVSTPS
jgi:hypothetical protein